MKHLTTILDKVASELEARGLRKLAAEVDVVANTLEAPNIEEALAWIARRGWSVSNYMTSLFGTPNQVKIVDALRQHEVQLLESLRSAVKSVGFERATEGLPPDLKAKLLTDPKGTPKVEQASTPSLGDAKPVEEQTSDPDTITDDWKPLLARVKSRDSEHQITKVRKSPGGVFILLQNRYTVSIACGLGSGSYNAESLGKFNINDIEVGLLDSNEKFLHNPPKVDVGGKTFFKNGPSERVHAENIPGFVNAVSRLR